MHGAVEEGLALEEITETPGLDRPMHFAMQPNG